ncbi:WbqC family protein [Wohlfahrtiimonas sp. G9077]|uniref:WbqC family protein n=1 Tax=Wohlfahrtiimonas sp. G9077 TaxID=1980118 RepID=UPI000B99A778|nr:WbqC family protein [Wohlfahrtiimonas sp. G9077]OYQ72535.1 hypothetical protein B9T20_09315 [Wohlfahrtiimonas sp. G9077]
MKLAIMQPYFFPYIGYFQLIYAVDKFIFYDDVSFIKKGWINRNNLLVNNSSSLFTVPLHKASQNSKINNTKVSEEAFYKWKNIFLKTLEFNYKKAPNFSNVFNIIQSVLNKPISNVSQLATQSVIQISEYLNLPTKFILSSKLNHSHDTTGSERILNICIQEKADVYINPIGGQTLYSKDQFKEKNIELFFLKSGSISYPQFSNDFVPNLSIIDVLMFNSIEETHKLIKEYTLI